MKIVERTRRGKALTEDAGEGVGGDWTGTWIRGVSTLAVVICNVTLQYIGY